MDSCDAPISILDGKPEDAMLSVLNDFLLYLLRNIETLKSYLSYKEELCRSVNYREKDFTSYKEYSESCKKEISNNFIPEKHYSTHLPILMKECEPFLVFLELAARSTYSPEPETFKKELLNMSELLVKHLEHLSLLYSSFGLISLDDTDPEGMPAVLCGSFCLGGNYQISIFRYFSLAPYSPAQPNLYKRMRWNVEVTTGSAEGSMITTQYYFLCCREEPIMGVSELIYAPDPSESQKQVVWSIGQWGALDPIEDTDMESWILCSQPTAYYNLLFTVGFHEPSHTASTDLLVQILSGSEESNATLQAAPPDFSANTLTSDSPSPGKDGS